MFASVHDNHSENCRNYLLTELVLGDVNDVLPAADDLCYAYPAVIFIINHSVAANLIPTTKCNDDT